MLKKKAREWLLIFYSVPSHPVSNRMMIWRKLAKAGAVQLKGAVYILPATDEHEEFFQWLIGEVKSMGGDGAFVRSADIRSMDESDIRQLFLSQAEQEYRGFERKLETIERKVQSIRKGAKQDENARLADHAGKLARELDSIQRRDFFTSPLGVEMKKRMQSLKTGLQGIGGRGVEPSGPITPKRAVDYQGRTWFTRKKPFIDRMASAWLIRRWIDPQARFEFLEKDQGLRPRAVSFDVPAGDFSHEQDRCTFEVLLEAFALGDRVLKKMGELVHELDLKDGKFANPLAAGVECILLGIRKTVGQDDQVLEAGIQVFARLYAALAK